MANLCVLYMSVAGVRVGVVELGLTVTVTDTNVLTFKGLHCIDCAVPQYLGLCVAVANLPG